VLHLDEDDLLRAGVADGVGGADGDVDGLTGAELALLAVESHDRGTGDDEPVLRSVLVALAAQPLPRRHDDALDLVVDLVAEHGVVAQGRSS
jgi:hypothetical protein